MCRRFFFWVTTFVTVIVFWNLENYFDPFDDALTMDDEFTSRGEKRWSWRRFERKRNGIAKVLLASGSYGEVPAIAAFAEVENKMVLRQLLRETPLEKLDYDIIHRDSPDARGIDVGLIYRKSRFKPLDVRAIRVSEEFATRDILYVKGVILGDQSAPWLSGSGLPEMSAAGRDTIHIFVNHWPSKRGGAELSDARREAARSVLEAACDSIRSCDSAAFILAMGDFNDTPDKVHLPLQNISEPFAARGEGTIKYRGNWELIDQCFVSDTARCRFSIFKPAFLMEKDRAYTGEKPRRTYVGPKYNGGLSDHLPIAVTLK